MYSKLSWQRLAEDKKENLFTALYVGSVFIILATVYYINIKADIWGRLVDFFSTLTLAPVPSTGISLPAPSPQVGFGFQKLYMFGFEFALGLGILEIAILILRVFLHSPVSRKAETIENVVFWLGASYLISTYLVNMTIQSEWFVFWAGIIMIFGVSLVARAFVIIANR